MFNLKSTALALLGSVTLLTGSALAQDSGPLVDLLLKKGIVTDQEAEDLRAELVKDFAATTSAGKLNLSSSLTELRIAGDVRVRYESRTGSVPSGDHQGRDRFRYRFRTALTGRVLNDWSFGVRLETGSGNRSSNVTMGTDGGPFAKTDDGVFIGQIYASWTPNANFNFTAGRMPNPLVTTSMVWDGDINPEGLAEQFKYRTGQTEYFATAAQFLYSGANTQNTFGSAAGVDDLFLFAWQGGVKYYVEGATNFFQIAPTVYQYVGTSQTQNPTAFRGQFSPTNAAPINNLFIVDVPFEYNWLAKNGVPLRAFGDVAINLDAEARARKYGRPDLDGENLGWQLGLQYGKAVNAGEWDARLFYQSVGAFALDTNLGDSDLFDSRTNMKGLVAGFNYALGAATQLSFTAANAERVNSSINAPGSGDIGSNNALDDFWLFQADLNVKF